MATLTFEKLLKNICTMFNCQWDIEDNGTVFRIEHYSYTHWQSAGVLNLTLDEYKPYTAFKRKYTYQVDSMPKYEKFKFMESAGQDFNGTDIWYDSTCVSTDDANKNKQYEADIITTDVAFVMANPDPDSKLVSDEGFVLVACYYDANVIITEKPILTSEYRVNNTLAWAQLHNDYFRQGRILRNGYLNRILTGFDSSIKTKLQDKISIPACCGHEFNPNDIVTTSLGTNGQVSKATYSLATGVVELEVMFDANDGLFNNQKPVALTTTAVCEENSHVDITVTGLVSDPDNNLDLSANPFFTGISYNGTATVIGAGKIRFTPDAGYYGSAAYFFYGVRDIYGEESNTARIDITVTPVASAVNDTYTAFEDETFIANLLANDVGPGITVTGFNAVSTHGGTVSITTGGALTYTPATGYTGSDSFTYTITDSGGHTSTGTVNLTVSARPAVYVQLVQTYINTSPVSGSCGEIKKYSMDVYFYTDSFATHDIDVTGFGINLIYRRQTFDGLSHDAQTPHDYTVALAGRHMNLSANEITLFNSLGCGDTYWTVDFTLQPGTHYTII